MAQATPTPSKFSRAVKKKAWNGVKFGSPGDLITRPISDGDGKMLRLLTGRPQKLRKPEHP